MLSAVFCAVCTVCWDCSLPDAQISVEEILLFGAPPFLDFQSSVLATAFSLVFPFSFSQLFRCLQ